MARSSLYVAFSHQYQGRADVKDNGDRIPHPPEDAIPTGLAKGMEKYLRRGPPKPNGRIKEAILASGGKDANGSKM